MTPRPPVVHVHPEWSRHAATWMQWPHTREDKHLGPTFARIIKELQPYEAVQVIVSDEKVEATARQVLADQRIPMTNVRFFQIPTDWCWCRDSGPIFICGPDGLTVTDWRFTGWGRTKFYENDDEIPRHVAKRLGMRCVRLPMVLEGGAIEFNGGGAAITAWPCLHHRNCGMLRERMGLTLQEVFGLEQVIWLERAPSSKEDYTKGHTDGICRFINEDTVVVGRISDQNDPVAKVFDDAAKILSRHFCVERMDVPTRLGSDDGIQRGNYLNWYVANDVVLVGTFGQPKWDEKALCTISGYWPSRKVIGVDIQDLWQAGGGIHCVTQQQPAEPNAETVPGSDA